MQTARVFLSSTFLDFAWEREITNRVILPELNAALAPAGTFVDLIDLRWGVTEETGLDHAAVDICLTEVERCCTGGSRPAFVFLHGEREGWAPLPRVLDAGEFAMIANALAVIDPLAEAHLRAWYRLDENFVPPSYALRSRRNTPEQAIAPWAAIEHTIRDAVARSGSHLPPAAIARFCTPITQIEVASALTFARERVGVIAAMRRSSKGEMPGSPSADASWKLLERLVDDAPLILEDQPHGGEYRRRFEQWMRNVLVRSAKSLDDGPRPVRTAFANTPERAVPRRLEQSLATWLDDGDGVRLLHGASGSGKTTIVRRIVSDWRARGQNATVLLLGHEQTASDRPAFLAKAADAILGAAPAAGEAPAATIAQLHAALAAPASAPRLLCVDALEHVSWDDPSESTSWLPLTVGAGHRILLTTSDDAVRAAFAELFAAGTVVELDEMDDAESEQQIAADLAARHRTLRATQRSAIVAATRDVSGRALVNRIAASWAQRLPDDGPVPPTTGLAGWIRRLLDDLATAQGHGDILVNETFALLCAARRRISERTTFGVLSQRPTLLSWIPTAFPHAPGVEVLPRTVFSRLVADLEGLVDVEVVAGDLYFSFTHRLLYEGVLATLSTEALATAHLQLANRWTSEWAYVGASSNPPGDLLSEVLYQNIRCGAARTPALLALVSDIELLTAKTAPPALADTIEDVAHLLTQDGFTDATLREFGEFIIQERAAFRALPDRDERRTYILHTIESMLRSNPLRQAVLERTPGGNTRLVRPRLAAPRMRGLVRIDGASTRAASILRAANDELVVAQADGSIAIVGATYGEVRRRLPGHRARDQRSAIAGARLLPGNRVLSWGADGQAAISSIAAGRELVRMRGGDAPLEYAAPTPSGAVIASSYRDHQIFKWAADGRLVGRIDIRAGDGAVFSMTNGGLEPQSAALRRDLHLPMMSESGNEIMPAFHTSFVVLDDDTVAIGGMGTLSIWSFKTHGPEILIEQLFNQDFMPKYVVPASAGGIIVAANGGAVLHLHVADARADVLQASGNGRGGADPLDPERLFCWSLGTDNVVHSLILHRRTGAVMGRYQLHAARADRLEYFRGGGSNVPRGLIRLEDHVLGWSGYGCEAIDLDGGIITPLSRWPFSEYVTKAIKVTNRDVLLLKAGRPVLYNSAQDRQTHDFVDLSGEFEHLHDLGAGRVIAVRSTGGCWFWNVSDSLDWIGARDWTEFGREPRSVIDAQVMPDGDIAVQRRRRDDATNGAEIWRVGASGCTLTGRLPGLPMFGNADVRHDNGVRRIGPLVLTWGGPPPAVSIGVPPSDLVFAHQFDEAARIDICTPLFDHAGDSPFGLPSLVCASEHTLHVVALPGGLRWQLPVPDDTRIIAVIPTGRDLLIATMAGLWRATFPARLPRNPTYSVLASASAFATATTTVTCADVLHGAGGQSGLAIFTVAPARENRDAGEASDDAATQKAATIVAAYTLVDGVIAHHRFEGSRSWHACEDGVVVHDNNGGPTHVRIRDDSTLDVRVLTEGTDVPAPHREAQRSWAEHASGIKSERPLIDSRGADAIRFVTTGSGGVVSFDGRAVSVEHGGVTDTWSADDDYFVLDVDEEVRRIVLRTRGGTFQVLDVGPDAVEAPPIDAAAIVEAAIAPERLQLLRRCGGAELARRAILRWVQGPGNAPGNAVAPLRMAALLAEFANALIALGDRRGAATAENNAHAVLARAGATNDPAAADVMVALVHVALQSAVLDGDVDRVAAYLFPDALKRDLVAMEQRAWVWIDTVLGLVTREPERARAIAEYRGRMENTLRDADLLPNSALVRAALEDIDALVALATPVEQDDLGAIDWRAALGAENEEILDSAERGSHEACVEIGSKFGRGDGVNRNPRYASYWYERAIAAGSALAAMNLAHMYRHGEGLTTDLQRGYELTKLAAERGLTPAKCNLGVMLLRGDGCAADPFAARRWLQEAVDEGDDMAPLSLAVLHATGQGGPQDIARARALLVPLAARGNQRAAQVLAFVNRQV